MSKKCLNRLCIGIILFSIIYVISLMYTSTNIYYKILVNIMGIGGCITSALLIYVSFNKSNRLKSYGLLMLLTAISFTVGEIIWFIKEIFSREILFIEKSAAIFYLSANFFLFLGTLILIKQHNIFKKILKDKVIFDIVIIFIMCIVLTLISIEPIVNSFKILSSINRTYLILSAILDLISLMNLSIIYVCTDNSQPTSKVLIINFFAVILYTLGDLVYIHNLLNNTYTSNSVVDSFWIIGLLLIALSSVYYVYIFDNKSEYNHEYKNHELISYLPIIPVIILFKIDISNNYQAIIGVFISIIIIRQIKVLNENRSLVNKYKLINDRLENLVLKRTEELTQKNEQLNYLSNKDTLTNLYNRRYLLNKLDEIIEISSRNNSKFGLLFIDLNKFKNINDLHGHDVGDLLLISIATELKKHSNEQNIVTRQGGDEFIIISTDINNEEDLNSLANKIMDGFNETICVKGHIFKVDLSIGGVIYPTDGQDKLTLMKKADMAMYTSKKNTSSRFVSYKETDNVYNRFKMEELMKKAIENKEFVLYYQPQFNIEHDKIVGVEALIRWINDELGFVSPAEFIPLAEETGLIIDIGNWVIESAFLQMKKWNDLYNLDLEIGINISPIQLSNENFLDTIILNLQQTNIDPSIINLELTEESAMNNSEENIKKIKKLRDLGLKIAIDDFGSGYSSFKYIKSFIVDTLKIDMSLIKGIDKTKEDYEIANAIINMGKGLDLNIVAEGVESESQLSTLRNLKCNTVQGYYYEKPLTVDELEKKYFI